MQTVKRTRRSAFSSSDPVSSTGHRRGDVSISHTPVLLQEVVECLAVKPDDVVLDATLGGAGHARELIKLLGPQGTFIGFDADEAAVRRAEEALLSAAPKVHLVQANFRTIRAALESRGIDHVTKALFDLGWSSYQLRSGRGFSFLADEPLLMTYAADPEKGAVTAETIVNSWGEESIVSILTGWGEERYARRIARSIVERRVKQPIKTTSDLVDVIRSAVPRAYAYGRLHPATKTFQALRIAVNDEMGALTEGLTAAWRRILPGGRIAVISFHSTEDRLVKRLFLEWVHAGEGVKVTKSPLVPRFEEVRANPRSRSAKLRVIEKL